MGFTCLLEQFFKLAIILKLLYSSKYDEGTTTANLTISVPKGWSRNAYPPQTIEFLERELKSN